MNYFSVLVRIFHAFIVQLFHFTKHYMNGDEVTPHDEDAPFDGKVGFEPVIAYPPDTIVL